MGNDEINKRRIAVVENARYWIWLQYVMGVAARVDLLLDNFATARDVYEASRDELRESGILEKRRLEKAMNKNLDAADKIVSICEENGYDIITPDMPEYPERLKLIADYPLVLYVCGDKSVLDSNNIHVGVIGARKPSQYGLDVAQAMSITLAKGGAIVVSGGAVGIDSTAHNSAMDAGGKTILTMGCGFGYNYLMKNEPMRQRIIKNGALVTEYAPGTPPFSGNFVRRNRITAGLCNGVLVVEAGPNSGSLSTANAVIRYNRDLFVITGDASGNNFLGANELAQKGARVVFSADDILTLYGYEIRNKDSFNFSQLGKDMFDGINVFPTGKSTDKPKRRRKKKSEPKQEDEPKTEEKKEIDISTLSPDAQKVYAVLGDKGVMLDDIAQLTKLQIRNVLITLTELEMEDAIEAGAGNEYRIK